MSAERVIIGAVFMGIGGSIFAAQLLIALIDWRIRVHERRQRAAGGGQKP